MAGKFSFLRVPGSAGLLSQQVLTRVALGVLDLKIPVDGKVSMAGQFVTSLRVLVVQVTGGTRARWGL